MYRTSRGLAESTSLTCPQCSGTRFRVNFNSVTCTDCGWYEKRGSNKFGAIRTEARDGIKRDSKYEAGVADELRMRKLAGDIVDYDSQFKVVMNVCCEDGSAAFSVAHKVDFRIHNRDGSFELLEAKGHETGDWKWRRKLLEELWLPLHLDHTYRVVKQSPRR